MIELFSNVHFLFFLLGFFILISVFFSLAETAFLSVNPYRVRHMVRHHHKLARRVQLLLERPDRMLGIILLCDTFADIFASAIATMIAVHYFGERGIIPATIILTFIVLIFGEIAPKTLATLHPLRIALTSAWPLTILLRVLYPLVWLANQVANGLLRLFGVHVQKRTLEHLSHEELRTVLHEAGGRLSADYRAMLLKVLDLEKVAVEDIMVPRNEVIGIDMSEDWDVILEQLTTAQHTRLPVYRESIDNILGVLHVRKALNLLAKEKLNKDNLLTALEENYFIPEGTPLNVQLINFRHQKRRIGLVVNEYGDIQGLVTLEDLLEEIVGEFTTDIATLMSKFVHQQADGSYLVDGSINVRELNRLLHCDFSTDGPRTLSGIIIEYLEMIPSPGTSLKLGNQTLEVVQVKGNMIKTVRVLQQHKALLQ